MVKNDICLGGASKQNALFEKLCPETMPPMSRIGPDNMIWLHYQILSIHLDGFVLIAKESIWPRLFGQYFMNIDLENGDQSEKNSSQREDDDMLFYVQQKPNDGEQEVSLLFLLYTCLF